MSRTLVHLSDLHFGTVADGIADRLAGAVREIQPDVVAVSGDLTQRARPAEFQQARAFLDRLPGHLVAVPGNHDVPLYNLYGRFWNPLERYSRFISSDLEPEYVDSEIAVIGINTARSLTFKGGRVNQVQMSRVRNRLHPLRPHVMRIIITHHPFELPVGHSKVNLVGRSRMAMSRLAESGADILLSGHLHQSHISDTVKRYSIDGHSALVVQAGTASSCRRRGEQNGFNCLRIEGTSVTVEQWVLYDSGEFRIAATRAFRKNHNRWDPVGAPVILPTSE